MKQRNQECRRFTAWMVGVSAITLFAAVCQATLPAVIDISFHAEGLLRAASVLGDREREWFEKELAKVSGPTRYMMYAPVAPMVGVRNAHELDHAIVGLICPSLARGEIQKIKDFFTKVNKLKLVRGRGNYAGWTLVSYQLLQGDGHQWRLQAQHQNVSGPSERAVLLREQTAPYFVTYINCADPRYPSAQILRPKKVSSSLSAENFLFLRGTFPTPLY